MHIDRSGFRVLSRAECLALLADADVGRIAVSSRALPLILPVRFAMDGDDVVIATQTGTTLDTATSDTVVAFEADGPARGVHVGWSVHVNGIARHVVDPVSINRFAALGLPTPGADEQVRYVAISTEHIAGRAAVDATSAIAGIQFTGT